MTTDLAEKTLSATIENDGGPPKTPFVDSDLEMLEALPVTDAPLPARLPIDQIEELALLQARAGLNEYHVSQLMKALAATEELPPVLVLHRGERSFLIDGHHRVAACARTRKGATVPVIYFAGTPADAILESQRLNSMTVLAMTNPERQDGAWKLVKLGRYTLLSIMAATGVSRAQAGIMRRAFRALGEDAHDISQWGKALRAFKGKPEVTFNEEEIESMLDSQAARFADRLVGAIGTLPADKPELLARVLETYAGRRLPELMRVLKERNGDADFCGEDGDF